MKSEMLSKVNCFFLSLFSRLKSEMKMPKDPKTLQTQKGGTKLPFRCFENCKTSVLNYFLFKGNTTTTEVDFFDSAFTFSNVSIEVGCCARDTRLTNVTCGRGTSCTGQCSAIEASLCPSGNCTEDPEDCRPNLLLAEEEGDGKGRSYATLPSWVFNWCTHRCPVRYHPSCCFHPTCRRRRRKLCSWMNYLTGDPH